MFLPNQHAAGQADLAQQIACVRRELGYRERVYARRVDAGKMTPQLAARELAHMRAVLATLEKLVVMPAGISNAEHCSADAVREECARICEAGADGTSVEFAAGCRSCAQLIRADIAPQIRAEINAAQDLFDGATP